MPASTIFRSRRASASIIGRSAAVLMIILRSANSAFDVTEATMDIADTYSSDVAFTPTVKAVQSRKGSRQAYARMEERGGWQTRITPDLAEFIAAQTSMFLATANAQGQPYIQHRGGPAGFLHVLDD